MPDPLDDFLDRGFSCEPPEALKNALRQRTTGLLRRGRWTRRLLLAGAAAACYLAGLATMWSMPPRTIVVYHEQPVNPPVMAENKVEPTPVVEVKLPESALVYEWKGQLEPDHRATHFFKAGDFFFVQRNDPDSALVCYMQALDVAGPRDLDFSPDDNWLVMALKNAKRKEIGHGN